MVVLELGPVAHGTLVGDALPAGARVYTVNQGEAGVIGSSAFRRLGRSLGGDVARVAGVGGGYVRAAEEVVLAVFSAGWGLAEEIFLRGDPRVVGWLGVDAYYSALNLAVHPGHLAFVQRACRSEAWALASSSSFGGSYVGADGKRVEYASCEQSFFPVVTGAGMKRLGTVEQQGPLMGVPAWGLGCAAWYPCGNRWSHREQATVVAPWLFGEVEAVGVRQPRLSVFPEWLWAGVAAVVAAGVGFLEVSNAGRE